jgi:hypothetical protein
MKFLDESSIQEIHPNSVLTLQKSAWLWACPCFTTLLLFPGLQASYWRYVKTDCESKE